MFNVCYFAELFDGVLFNQPSSQTTNCPLPSPSDTMSHALSSDSTSIPKHGSYEGLNAGGGTESGKEKAGKNGLKVSFPCANTTCNAHSPAWDRQELQNASTVDILSDEVLLEIFGSINQAVPFLRPATHPVWEWHRLVHVCRRWRQIIFASHPVSTCNWHPDTISRI